MEMGMKEASERTRLGLQGLVEARVGNRHRGVARCVWDRIVEAASSGMYGAQR